MCLKAKLELFPSTHFLSGWSERRSKLLRLRQGPNPKHDYRKSTNYLHIPFYPKHILLHLVKIPGDMKTDVKQFFEEVRLTKFHSHMGSLVFFKRDPDLPKWEGTNKLQLLKGNSSDRCLSLSFSAELWTYSFLGLFQSKTKGRGSNQSLSFFFLRFFLCVFSSPFVSVCSFHIIRRHTARLSTAASHERSGDCVLIIGVLFG